MTIDVAVIGGGVYGASTLYHLAARGVRAALYERDHLASGPTGSSVANVRLHYTMPELAELARRSYGFYATFSERMGRSAGFHRIGMAYGVGPDDAPTWTASVERLRGQGFEIELLGPEDLAELLPGWNLEGLAVGAWEPGAGYADPVGTTTAFAERAVELGASVHQRSRVEAIISNSGRVAGVRLADGTEQPADAVVLAVGPWTNQMLAPLGIQLPLFIERHTIAVLEAPDARSICPVAYGDFAASFYIRPEGSSTILLGDETPPSRLDDPDNYDPVASLDEAAGHVATATRRIPALDGLGIRRGYASLYDVSDDRLHIIDTVPGVEGLFVVCGTSGHGFKLAPAMGEEIANLVTGRPSSILEPFRIDRVYDVDRERSR